jgi:WD40-like Beta Propeller Repeat
MTMRLSGRSMLVGLAAVAMACQPVAPTERPSAAPAMGPEASRPAPVATRTIHTGSQPYVAGTPIALGDLSGRIVFDDFEDLRAMDVDGTHVIGLADGAGPEFDGSWSPDGARAVYRDSRRGINTDDEIFVVGSNGSARRNLTNDPGNDWGPDWSPDGTTIAFNSDRAGGAMGGYLMDPDGSNVRMIDVDTWIEYPSWSPDAKRLAFMGAVGSNYEIFTIELETQTVRRLTNSPGQDGWPVWSPDGRTIAFTSMRDDCAFAGQPPECWRSGDIDPHRDIWLVDADGGNPRRATPEYGQFMAWSPDGAELLVSGYALFVVRPDGTGRLELRADGIPRALGGIPDWTAGRS